MRTSMTTRNAGAVGIPCFPYAATGCGILSRVVTMVPSSRR